MIQSLPRLTLAPISPAPVTADLASSDIRGFLSTEVPSAMAAKATARMVWDFEAGMRMLPLNIEDVDLIFTGSIFLIRVHEYSERRDQMQMHLTPRGEVFKTTTFVPRCRRLRDVLVLHHRK